MPTKTASIITDLNVARQVLAPLAIVSCDTVGETARLVPGSQVLVAVSRAPRGEASADMAASIAWGSEDQDPLDLVDEAEQDIATFLGYGLRDSPRPPPPATIMLKLSLRHFVRITQEVYGETMKCLRPFAQMAAYASVMYRGARYTLVEK